MSKKTKLILASIGAVVLVAAALALHTLVRPSSGQLVSVEQGPMAETVTETAELHAYDSAAIYTSAPQTIATVHAALGQRVSAGELLITYHNTSDLQLAQLQAQRQSAAAQYEAQIATAALSVQDAKQAASDAQKQYDRQKQLYEAGALSQTGLEAAETVLTQTANALTAAQTALSGFQSQQQAQLAQIDASLAILAQQNEDAIITAPFDGIVTECPFSAGASVPMGTLVIEVAAPEQLYLQADLLSEDAARVSLGTTVRAVQSDYDVQFDDLTVTQLAPKAKQTTSSLGVEQKRLPVQIALPAGALSVPLGSQWDATFTLSAQANALWLPKTYVYSRGGQSLVLLPDGRTEQPVTTGLRQDDRIQILDGLAKGDQVRLPE